MVRSWCSMYLNLRLVWSFFSLFLFRSFSFGLSSSLFWLWFIVTREKLSPSMHWNEIRILLVYTRAHTRANSILGDDLLILIITEKKMLRKIMARNWNKIQHGTNLAKKDDWWHSFFFFHSRQGPCCLIILKTNTL